LKDSRPPIWILIVGFGAIVVSFAFYAYVFGFSLSQKHYIWAEFGSFFGGLLNPLLSFLAIVMIYQTIVTQISEFKISVTHLSRTAEFAAQDLELSKKQSLDNETLAVLAKAEKQLSDLLNQVVSESGKEPEMKIFHMCMEARRRLSITERSDSYTCFLDEASTEGSVVWPYVYSLYEIVERMVAILNDYSTRHSAQFSPTILYYHKRVLAVSQLLADANFISETQRVEIVTMADQHG